MQELASLVIAFPRVAEIGTLENMTLGAICSLLTEAKKTKRSANRCGRGGFRMRKGTLSLSTVAFGIVQTVWHTLRGHVVGQVASIAVGATTFFEKVFAQRNLVWVVYESALGALWA